MDLLGVVTQAGRHFASSANPAAAGVSDVKARQFANSIAWYLMSMLDPKANSDKELILSPSGDPDVQRLAMELFGVGGALELLRVLNVVDGRTLKKRADRFDFEATQKKTTSKILIEVKGTLNNASRAAHQRSISAKMNDTKFVPVRGYSRALGVIFFGWSANATKRREDFQIADPEFEDASSPDSAHRAILVHYADLFETAGLVEAAERFRTVSKSEGWPPSQETLREQIGHEQVLMHRFSRARHIFQPDGGEEREYWGGYWQAGYIPPMVDIGGGGRAKYAFVGVDARVPQLVAEGRFEDLVSLSCPHGSAVVGPRQINVLDGSRYTSGSYSAVVHATGEGSLYVWSSEIPSDLVILK